MAEPNNSLSKELLNSIKTTLESSTIHAIPNIIRNKFYLIKIVWFLCLIASTGVCAWLIQKSITDYFNYDVVSKTDIVYVNQIKLPIVSICNLNLFSTEKGSQHVLSLSRLIYGHDNYFGITFKYPSLLITNSVANISNYLFDRKSFGLDLKDLIIKCEFSLQQPCDLIQDFEYFYDVNYGNCFRFNSGRNMLGQQVPFKYVSKTGIYNAFKLELFIGKASENKNLLSEENGLIVFINNETLDSTAYEGIQIAPGFSTRIILNKYSLKKVSYPYSECTDNLISIDSHHSAAFKRTFSPKRIYHYTDCTFTCYIEYIIEKCSCLSGSYNLDYDYKVQRCISLFNLHCEFTAAVVFFNNTDLIEKCDCPIECEKSGYSYVTSFAEFPTRDYSSKHLETNDLIKSKLSKNQTYNFTYQDVRESVAKLVIFYDELKETKIIHDKKFQLIDLIANIGGVLGLFLGFLFFNLKFIKIFINLVYKN
jgi:hypothetical protein